MQIVRGPSGAALEPWLDWFRANYRMRWWFCRFVVWGFDPRTDLDRYRLHFMYDGHPAIR